MPEPVDYNSDPAAIAWARAKIQHRVDHYRNWERQARERGDVDRADQWRRVAVCIERDFLGSVAGGHLIGEARSCAHHLADSVAYAATIAQPVFVVDLTAPGWRPAEARIRDHQFDRTSGTAATSGSAA